MISAMKIIAVMIVMVKDVKMTGATMMALASSTIISKVVEEDVHQQEWSWSWSSSYNPIGRHHLSYLQPRRTLCQDCWYRLQDNDGDDFDDSHAYGIEIRIGIQILEPPIISQAR
jgi:hypothetical protein